MLRTYHIEDFVDAASHSGHAERAQATFTEFTASAAQEPRPLLTANIVFAPAMLAHSDDAADKQFELALAGELRLQTCGPIAVYQPWVSASLPAGNYRVWRVR